MITKPTRRRRLLLALPLVAGLATASFATSASAKPGPAPGKPHYTLTILHNNDSESNLIDAGPGLEDFGGVARFQTVVDREKDEARTNGKGKKNRRGVVMVSSGDNFLAGPEFNASVELGTWFDAKALDLIGYDAIQLGNHDFDFGPDTLAAFISEGFSNPGMPPYLGANLDFSGEPALQALADAGVIAGSTVVKERGEWIGIVGAITPNLPFISSPGDTVVDPDVAGVLQAEIDALTANGVEIIVVISHLQGVAEDITLASFLDDVDVMVAGGGDEVLANEGDLLVPGDTPFGPYPLLASDADGDTIPVVTTAGNYKYLGQLVVDFDKDGNVIGWDGGPIRIAGGDNPDAVPADPQQQAMVVDPVADYVASLADQIIAESDVGLNAIRSFIRSVETNEGNLIADAYFSKATELAPDFGVASPDVAMTNGGGIRNDSIIPPGPLSVLTTFEMLPFGNFVTVVEGVDRQAFKDLLENAVSRIGADGVGGGGGTGRFAQISRFAMEYDSTQQAAVIDADGNITTPGQRVLNVTLDDSTPIVVGGVVQPGPDLNIATNAFSASGGDQWDFGDAPFTSLGVTDQQMLQDFLEGPLGGVVSATDYPSNIDSPCDGERIDNVSPLCVGPTVGP
jgi:5'-nucleotidase